MGENVSTLAISERCHYYGIILKSPKRHRAAESSLLTVLPVTQGCKRLNMSVRQYRAHPAPPDPI
ncbi:hypothetical protein EMIT0196MI5_150021 [Pseudomonas sp. IT-196MI5]